MPLAELVKSSLAGKRNHASVERISSDIPFIEDEK
jgi:hypothetical protein